MKLIEITKGGKMWTIFQSPKLFSILPILNIILTKKKKRLINVKKNVPKCSIGNRVRFFHK